MELGPAGDALRDLSRGAATRPRRIRAIPHRGSHATRSSRSCFPLGEPGSTATTWTLSSRHWSHAGRRRGVWHGSPPARGTAPRGSGVLQHGADSPADSRPRRAPRGAPCPCPAGRRRGVLQPSGAELPDLVRGLTLRAERGGELSPKAARRPVPCLRRGPPRSARPPAGPARSQARRRPASTRCGTSGSRTAGPDATADSRRLGRPVPTREARTADERPRGIRLSGRRGARCGGGGGAQRHPRFPGGRRRRRGLLRFRRSWRLRSRGPLTAGPLTSSTISIGPHGASTAL